MSAATVRAAWKATTDSPSHKLVLLYLAHSADVEHGCTPSLDEIRSACGISRSTAKRHLEALRTARLITKSRIQRPNGTLGLNRIRINVEKCEQLPVYNSTEVIVSDLNQGSTVNPRPGSTVEPASSNRDTHPSGTNARDNVRSDGKTQRHASSQTGRYEGAPPTREVTQTGPVDSPSNVIDIQSRRAS